MAVVLSWPSAWAALAAQTDSPAQSNIVEQIVEGYERNRRGFLFGTTRYRHEYGNLSDPEDLSIRSRTITASAEGLWAFDGTNIRIDRRSSEMREPATHTVYCRSVLAEYILPTSPESTGQLSIRRIDPTSSLQLGAFVSPWNMGNVGADGEAEMPNVLRNAMNGNGWAVSVAEEATKSGDPLTVITVKTQGATIYRFRVDTKRGYLPLHAVTYDINTQRPLTRTTIDDIQECSGGRWLPRRLTRVDQVDKPRFHILELVEVSIDQRPTADVFQLKLAQGTTGVNELDGTVVRADREQFVVDVVAIAQSHEPLHDAATVEVAAGSPRPAQPPPLQVEIRQHWFRRHWLLCIVAFLVSVAGAVALRYGRKKRSQQSSLIAVKNGVTRDAPQHRAHRG